MQNTEVWKPTKFIIRKGKLLASRNTAHLGIGSRLIAQLVALRYEESIPKHVTGRLADIGCGNVPLYEYYRPYADSITTIDWAESLHDSKYLDIIWDLNKTPIDAIPDSSFDAVICSDVLEHIYEPKLFLSEIYRIMMGDGKLMLNVPYFYWIHEAPHDYYRYTEYALTRMLNEAGFEQIQIKPIGGIIISWIDITAKCLAKMTLIGRTLAKLMTTLVLHIIKTKWGTRILEYRSDTVPLGYFVIAQKR
jgi:2-polyprenyl-3-methyl-5-hydroxy-6-metoxy-1,4-benzoquinol methylase